VTKRLRVPLESSIIYNYDCPRAERGSHCSSSGFDVIYEKGVVLQKLGESTTNGFGTYSKDGVQS